MSDKNSVKRIKKNENASIQGANPEIFWGGVKFFGMAGKISGGVLGFFLSKIIYDPYKFFF